MKRIYLLAALVWATVASAQDVVTDLLPGWKEVARPATPYPTKTYQPADGREASLVISILGPFTQKVTSYDDVKRIHRGLVEKRAADVAEGGGTREISHSGIQFLYTSFQDPDFEAKRGRPNEFKFETVCMGVIGGQFVFAASCYTNARDGREWKEALLLVQRTHLATAKPDEAADAIPGEAAIQPKHFRVLVTVPEWIGVEGNVSTDDRDYFLAVGVKTQINLSGWFSDAKEYAGFNAFWARERQVIPELMNERMEAVGNWRVVFYALPIGENSYAQHARACAVSGGTWVDLHLSKVGGDEAVQQLRRALREMKILAQSR